MHISQNLVKFKKRAENKPKKYMAKRTNKQNKAKQSNAIENKKQKPKQNNKNCRRE